MSNDKIERAGFDRPAHQQQTAQQRTALALIATVALAVSTMVAATVVSIGMARADMLGAVPDGGRGPFAVAFLLAILLAGMGGLTAAVTRRKPPSGSEPR
jgi:hypothetical protein